MSPNLQTTHNPALRQLAEASLRKHGGVKIPNDLSNLSQDESLRLLHDLRVHQIELEMQNEELRRTQDELAVSRARYFDLYDLAPVGYCTISSSGLIQQANLAAAALLGLDRGALVKQMLSRFICKESQDMYYLHRKELLITGGTQACEVQMQKVNGIPFWAHLTATAVQDDKGTTVLRIVITDINALKQAEAELHQHRHHLEELVQSRTTELATARDTAEAASRAKSTFLANMSHELRTPLHGMMGLTDIALHRATDPKQIDLLTKSLRASRHLLAIINDVLDLAKIEADRMTLEETNFSLVQVIDVALGMEEDAAQAKNIHLLREINPPLPDLLCGDALRLKQIMLNFIGNAIKFSDGGEVTVAARVIEEDSHSLLLRIDVTDQGIGISPEQQALIFHAFQQVDDSNSRKYGGTGLGLIISKRLANLMGGDVGVNSEIGQGSTFWMTARLKRAITDIKVGTSPEAATPKEILQQQFQGTRVLIAEDEPINQDIARFLLEEAGLVADMVSNGREAIEKAQTGHYALILLDLQMPVMSGLEATIAIRQIPGLSTIPILALTASAFDEDRELCIEAGMNDHISKPSLPEVFYATVLRWLQQTSEPAV